MQIQHRALAQHLKHSLLPMYILVGPDSYFIGEEANAIKTAFGQKNETDHKLLTIQTPNDWNLFIEEANSYSLFANKVILDIRYDKKSMDAYGKKAILDYLSSINSRCLVIIRCPNVSVKPLQWLTANQQVMLISAFPLSSQQMKNWIKKELQQHQLTFSPHIVELILYKVQGNMMACSQAIQKILLTHPPQSHLIETGLFEQLSDQCEYQLYDLTEACLKGETELALQVLGKLLNNHNENSLVLWMLTQEIRLLLQINHLIRQHSFAAACTQLKIWRQRTSLYQVAMKRLSQPVLQQLLITAHQIDNLIKKGAQLRASHLLASLVLSLCKKKA